MAPKIITVRELHKSLPAIAKRVAKGQSYVVTRYAKTLFRIEPDVPAKKKDYTLDDIMKLRFKGGKTLSMDVDKILYGA
jgi:antitoxin (DNA-binding transcriptional repressor) of toxin-antitoxin stability system